MGYKERFVQRMLEACRVARLKGAVFNEPVCLAQAALESNWGRSGLATRALNLFGIKAGRSWAGPVLELPTKEWSKERGTYDTVARWRVYPSWNECIVDYATVLNGMPWYQDAVVAASDPEAFLQGLLPNGKEPGWATDPGYAEKVRRMAREIARLGGPQWPDPPGAGGVKDDHNMG